MDAPRNGPQSDGSYGRDSEQVGLTAGVFEDYQGNDFRLVIGTEFGADYLTSLSWWDQADAFFDGLDSDLDVFGNRRGEDGVWDRGAFELHSGQQAPAAPSSLRLLQGNP